MHTRIKVVLIQSPQTSDHEIAEGFVKKKQENVKTFVTFDPNAVFS